MRKERLNGGWEHYTGSLGGVWEVWRGDKLANHYNVPWHSVTLPHTYNGLDVMDADVKYYQGPGWYRTRLSVDNPYKDGRTLLHFEGAGQRTEVYVYTRQVGAHLGGYDEFTVDITEAVAELDAGVLARYQGRVPVAAQCDNSRELETIPSDASDFNLYGGLYRYVNLVYAPAVSLGQVHVEPVLQEDGSYQVQVRTALYNPLGKDVGVCVTVKLKDAAGRVIQTHQIHDSTWEGERELVATSIAAPCLWSPADPYLYRCEVTVASECGESAEDVAFGLRSFEFVEHGPFKLNGERLLLRGTHRHEDHAEVGAAMTEEMIRSELRLMKEMGVNFIRLGHYQQSRIVLECCDELGILVWEEIPWCRGGLGGESYRQQCRDMLAAMIGQHYNHPSVILWGLGNENDWECDFDYFDQAAIRAFMSELHGMAHRLDRNRLTAIRRCDFCKDIVDVYSPSIWAGWYRGIYTDYESSCRQALGDVRSFFHMEWGADNLATRHVEKTYTGFEMIPRGSGQTDERDGDYLLAGGDPRVSRDGDWSETYFCEMIDWYLMSQEKMDWLTGAAQWAFKDFATPVRPDSPIPYLNMKGIVERDLTKKEAYYVFQSYWSEKPMVRIYGHTMPVRWGTAEERKQIKVYSNCAEVELFLNGVSLGVRQRDPEDFPCAGLRWETVLEPGENRVRAVGVKDGGMISDELVFVYQTEVWGEPAQLLLKASKQEDGYVYLEARAVDAAGCFCPDAAGFVRFGLCGDGRLLDNLGTIRGSRLVQLAGGRAGIRFAPRGGLPAAITESGFVSAGGPASALAAAGEAAGSSTSVSVISVACEGLRTAFLTWQEE